MKLEDLKKDSWRYAVQAMVGDLTDRIRESPDDPEGYIVRGRNMRMSEDSTKTLCRISVKS